jgi:hypothetical protein
MKKGMLIFWGLYLLFFCIPFPIIIYMATDTSSDTYMPESSLFWSWFWLGLSVLIWGYILWFFIDQSLIQPVKDKKVIQNIAKNGIERKAVITSQVILKNETLKNQQLLQLNLRFNNLNNYPIEDSHFFVDIKPEENRFAKGKEIDILLNRNVEHTPYFILKGQQTKYNNSGMLYRSLGFVLLLAYVAGLYIYFYDRDSKGHEWQFLTFMHPIIFTGFMILLFVAVYQFLLKPLMFGKKWEQKLLYAGKMVSAEIRNVRQTGLLVNDQPEVRFDVSYANENGVVYQAFYKKVVQLIDIPALRREGYIDIMYSDEKPEKIVIPNIFNH